MSHESKKTKTSEELHIFGGDKSKKSTLCDRGIQSLAIHPRDLDNLRIPKPPKDRQKAVRMACVRKTQPLDGVRDAHLHPWNLDLHPQPLDITSPEVLQLDGQGMVVPHSILGSLEDFRSYLEAKGENELVQLIPKSPRDPPLEAPERHHSEAVENRTPSGSRDSQSNALHHWHTHMRQRRWQQGVLSDLLDTPVENLLMNQADCFRETQEQREFLNNVMPLVHSGYGYRVGSEFWSLPQRYGDEMSGITATLTQTEQGRLKPITYVRQPSSIRQESGIICAETVRAASRTWDQSAYLQKQCQELGEVLRDMDIKKPDMDGLEVIGKPLTSVTVCRSPLLEKEEEEKMEQDNIDPLAMYDDVQSDALLIPALRLCGQLASWTGNSNTNQGEVGIGATIILEALTAERVSSPLELHNEGSAAIFYSWQRLPVRHSFPNPHSQTKTPHFYFNCGSGVILPGDSKRLEVIFKSEEPGITTELWQLNTHPVLLQGASMQVTLRGVALYQDKTADKRLFLETKLEKIVVVNFCRSIVYGLLRGIHTPERPASPPERYITEEQVFLSKNPKLQYLHQPVEDLKGLWQEAKPGCTWDLSVDQLRKVVLSLPEQESAQEHSLAQLNSLLLKLSEPSDQQAPRLTAAATGLQLWRKLLDTMAGEAMCLRNLLDLPENDTWMDKIEEAPLSDAGETMEPAENIDEKNEKKGGGAAKEEKNGLKSKMKEENKVEFISAANEKSVEDSKKKGKRKEEVGKRSKEKQRKGSSSLSDNLESIGQLEAIYTRLLHTKVYALMEDLVDNLCDMMNEGDEH